MEHYDVVVIGSGPAGEGAAMMAAKHGKRVAVVERNFEVGGGCTHWGTIPSKALRHAVKTLGDLRSNPWAREFRDQLTVNFAQLLGVANQVVDKQVAMRRRFYDRNDVPVLQAEARFVDPHTLELINGARRWQVSADTIVLATGSRPYHPPGVDFSHPRLLDSDSVLRYPGSPRSVTIYGAGVIGCEYASIFVNLGLKVNLVNTQDRLLSFLDEEITEALSYHLRDQGVVIRQCEQFAGVDLRDECVTLRLASGREVRSDILLWANGRTGNSDTLNLAAAGLQANARGQVAVDAVFRTSVAHIYAAGDIIGPPALASAAYDQGRYAAQHFLGQGVPDTARSSMIPSGIYTIPEISSVGKTERELRDEGVPYEIGHAMNKRLARAQKTSKPAGMLKLLFHARTLEVLGVHCFGNGASEIVHIGEVVMANPAINSIRQFVDMTFNYPTMAEAYRVAAFNGLNRL